MPDFTPAEIDLARQLALPRKLRVGDWYWATGSDNAFNAFTDCIGRGDDGCIDTWFVKAGEQEGWNIIWLPSIEDCFELLREAEHVYLEWDRPNEVWWVNIDQRKELPITSATPREALYRLLLEVRG